MTTSRLALVAALTLSVAALGACNKDSQSGAAQKAEGHVESAVGGAIGSDHLKTEGKKDEISGGVKSVVGDVKDTVKDATKH